MLGLFERFEGPANTGFDGVTSPNVLQKITVRIGVEHPVEGLEILGVEGPAITMGQVDDGRTIDQETGGGGGIEVLDRLAFEHDRTVPEHRVPERPLRSCGML